MCQVKGHQLHDGTESVLSLTKNPLMNYWNQGKPQISHIFSRKLFINVKMSTLSDVQANVFSLNTWTTFVMAAK